MVIFEIKFKLVTSRCQSKTTHNRLLYVRWHVTFCRLFLNENQIKHSLSFLYIIS